MLPWGFHVTMDWAPNKDRVHAVAAAAAWTRSKGMPMQVAQIFVTAPKKRVLVMSPTEADSFKVMLERENLRCIAHGSYLDCPWNGAPHTQTFLREELDIVGRAGIEGVVIHLDSAVAHSPVALSKTNRAVYPVLPKILRVGSGRGLEWKDAVVPSTGRAPYLYLESGHVKPEKSWYSRGDEFGKTWYDAYHYVHRSLLSSDGEENAQRAAEKVGLVLDTAHLSSCGVVLNTVTSAQSWISGFESYAAGLIQRRGGFWIHLNDSALPPGNGADEHAALGQGTIWSSDKGGLREILHWARRREIPCILERSGDINVARPKIEQDMSVIYHELSRI